MLLLILAVLGVAAFVFRSYIHAFILAKTTTAEEREQMLSQQKEHTQKELDDKGIVVRDLTEEEQQKLANNELSEEEAIDLILGVLELPEELRPDLTDEETETPPLVDDQPTQPETPVDDEPEEPPVTPSVQPKPVTPTEPVTPVSPVTPPADVQTPVTPSSPPEQKPAEPDTPPKTEQDPAVKEANEKVARLVAQLYVIKAQSISSIKGLEASMKADFLKIPYKERKEKNLFAQYIKDAASILASWEKESDAKVDGILSQITTIMKESGQDSSTLVDSLRKSYEDEKANIKAEYMSKVSS